MRRASVRAAILTLAVVASTTTAAFAQAAAPGAGAPSRFLRWRDGLIVDALGGRVHIQAASLIQLDTHAFGAPRPAGTDAVLVRRLRTSVAGRIGSRLEFRFLPEFAQARRVFDAYVDLRLSRMLHVRFGKDRPPVGYEMGLGAPFLTFPERSLLTGLVPNRDVGVQILGDIGRVSYAAGLFNESPDGTNGPLTADHGGHGDVAGRVVVRPFAPGTRGLGGVRVQLAGTRGVPDGAPPTYRTAGRATYSTAAAGERCRQTPGTHGSSWATRRRCVPWPQPVRAAWPRRPRWASRGFRTTSYE